MGRTSVCEKTGVRKGSWSPEEDKVLKTYITNNGHGNWKELPKLAGLLRCGKSCRFRWKNYLDPILNRGNFTKEEVDFIIEMHKLGYRWSKIASHLKGRTDNDIKNFYYTKLKKKDNDNDTPDRKRPKPAGNDITIGEIQSSSIPILESYSMLPIPPQISGSSPSQPISSQTSSHSPSSIDRPTNENHILKEPERDTIISLSDSEPERETLIQIYNRVWEEGLSKDPDIPVPPSKDAEEQTYPWDCVSDYDVNRSSSIDVPPLHFGSNLSRPNSSQSLSHSSSSSMDKSTYPWDCVYGYGIRGSSSPQRSLCRLISSRTFSRVSSSMDKSKNKNRILEETENRSLKQIYEGLSEDPHIPVPPCEEQTYPWDCDIQGSSFGNVSPQHFGSSSSQPFSSQTSSHSPSSIDRSTNENHILKEPERDIIINLSDSECPRDIIICLSDSECPHIEEPERETLIQIYNRLWEEGLSKDPHIPVPPSEEAEEQTYPWDCDVNRSSSIDVSPLHFGSNLSRPNSSQSLSHSSSSSMDKSKNKKIYERVWEEGLSEDPHIPVPVFEQQTYPWTSVYSVCHLEIDSSSSTEESENESSIPEETERGSLKQVYECVRTAVMWVRSLFGFNKTNCS